MGCGRRLRVWVLANASAVDPSLIIEEIGHAISSRAPTGDDVPLLDRAATDCDSFTCAARWREALGAVPGVEQAGRALAADEVHEDWLRALRWVPLLSEDVAATWATVCDILTVRYGRPSRETLIQAYPRHCPNCSKSNKRRGTAIDGP